MSKKVLFCAIASAVVVSLAGWSLVHSYSAPKSLMEENINALTDGEFDPEASADDSVWIVSDDRDDKITDDPVGVICTLGGDKPCKKQHFLHV